jgi:hypothetical protein
MSTINSVGVGLSGASGTGNFAGTTSPTFVTPVLGTPTSGTLTSCTGLPVGTGLATATDSAVLVSGSTGTPVWSSTMTNGQVIIGYTSGTPVAATISAGTGIAITNGTGTISIASSGGSGINSWIAASSTPITAAVNTGYYITDASAVTITLPATAAAGSVVAIVGNGAGGWVLAPGSGQTIKIIGSSASTSITSAEQYDCIEVLCVVANTTWVTRSLMSSGVTYS